MLLLASDGHRFLAHSGHLAVTSSVLRGLLQESLQQGTGTPAAPLQIPFAESGDQLHLMLQAGRVPEQLCFA